MSSQFHFDHHAKEAIANKRRFSIFTAALSILLVTVVGMQYRSSSAAQTTNPYSSSCTNPASTTLQYGSAGSCVYYLQWDLVHPVNAGAASLTIDGKFGSATKTAVINYQNARKLSADGIVGSNTWAQLLAKPTVNLVANGVGTSLTINKNDALKLSWTTGNTSASGYPSCTGNNKLSGATGTSGTIDKHSDTLVGSTVTLTYGISCSNTNGAVGDSVAVRINVAAISTPTLSTNGSPTSSSIPLKWTASTTTSSASIKSYTLHNTTTGGSYGITAPTVSYTVTGLVACKSYTFTVNATNSQTTNSAVSGSVTVATTGCPTPTTTNPTPVPTSTCGTSCNTTPSCGTTCPTSSGGSSTTTVTPKPVAPAPKPGVIAPTQAASPGTAPDDTTAPTAPEGFSAATLEGGNSISLSWSASTDASGIKGYNLERSTDQATWESVATGIVETKYDDKTVSFNTHYYYRMTATDTVGNTSEYATADTASPIYEPNAGSVEANLSSDDGVATVTLPADTTPSGADCSVIQGDAAPKLIKNQVVISGPYQLLCKDADGNQIQTFNRPLAWVYKFKTGLNGYGTPTAVSLDDSGKVAVSKSIYNKKLKTISFSQTNGSQSLILASKTKGLPVNLIIGVLFILGLFAGVFFFVLRRRQKENYSDYIRSKYYDL
jgi:peptidoglycan hydrolase-like protein with peptidoglycan-binding domain